MPTFNLLRDPWVPCLPRGTNPTPILLSLRDTLVQAHDLREIYTDSPLTTAALMRLMLAVLHRVFGPKDRWEWAKLWQVGRWDVAQLDDYFGRWAERFDLFDGQYPFYQVREFRADKSPDLTPVSGLVHEEASGNNVTLFDHHVDAEERFLMPDEAALRLITAQAYAIGLGQSHKFRGEQKQFRDGPCARGALFFVEGDSLFQTLLLSMRKYPIQQGDRRINDRSHDAPAWEQEDPFADGRTEPYGYLDYLTWQTWQIRLVVEETAEGVRVTHVRRCMGLELDKKCVMDPLKSYQISRGKDPSLRGFSEEKALWRESAALFEMSESNPEGMPQNLALLSELVRHKIIPQQARYKIIATGLATDPGHARNVIFWRQERLPLPTEYLASEEAVERLKNAIQLAENAGSVLESVCDWLVWLVYFDPAEPRPFEECRKSKDYEKAKKDKKRLFELVKAPSYYWWRLDQEFFAIMERLATDEEGGVLKEWCGTLRSAAQDAFHESLRALQRSGRAIRAAARAEELLHKHLNYVLALAE